MHSSSSSSSSSGAETVVATEATANITLESLGASAATPAPAATATAHYNPSSAHAPGTSSTTEERALALLGKGIAAESVASALGVTPARISQLLAKETFANAVSALRYANLQKNNARDEVYNTLEDKLQDKLEKSLPLMVRPDTILKALQVVNNAKRRGQTSQDSGTNTQNVVNLILPTVITEKFITNIDNQVTKAGEQELLTIQSGNLLKQVEDLQDTNREILENHDVQAAGS